MATPRILKIGISFLVAASLAGCTKVVVASPQDSPEMVAGSFVSYVGANAPEDAASLMFSSSSQPLAVDYGDIDDLRDLVNMPEGCSLARDWERSTKVVAEDDRYVVDVPVACGGERREIEIYITKGDEHWILNGRN